MNCSKARNRYETPSTEMVAMAVPEMFLNISVIIDPMDLILLDMDPDYEWDETLVDKVLL